ncbi:MAG: VapC toxin family PIN domain ribonuclease [Sulfobacillus benefaciens]|uniref:VapC toxin family PIN domain ribonuclease n=1 Tax=Sulfobacillus benefaciens TaxID=453960 RepID=A0A2T2X6S5_9FIRM|nr:MAG: VapC toxin family PIN domain ribonuclease [Sulfobacillus benefaciens]
MSAVNLAEIVSKQRDGGMPEPVIKDVLAELSLTIVLFDADSAFAIGLLIALTKSLGLSLGDRACLSLGITRHLPVLTTDRVWERLSLPVEIRAIRP